jgi:hypothetical protein
MASRAKPEDEAGSPGDHFSRAAVADGLQHATRPVPRTTDATIVSENRAGVVAGLLALARGGVCRAPTVTGRAVRSYRTVSPLPDPSGPKSNRPSAVSSLWHFP